MKILLIGNFAPPFEEENLQNITLYDRLSEDGHECAAINISKHSATDPRFVNPGSDLGYLLALMRLSRKRDVIHFATKGYLRVGLLKMMLSIFAAKIVRAKSVITFYPEFFSILGQMRSPFGGTQTLYTSFYLADRLIFADQDTYDVASMYKKRENFALVPAFIHVPESLSETDTSLKDKLLGRKRVILFTNVSRSSFLQNILKELWRSSPFPEDAAVVISSSSGFMPDLRALTEAWPEDARRNVFFLQQDALPSALTAFSLADIVLRPLTCDGEMFFEKFTISARKVRRNGSTVLFPGGLVFIKEGTAAPLCAEIINTISSSGERQLSGTAFQDPYQTILKLYV